MHSYHLPFRVRASLVPLALAGVAALSACSGAPATSQPTGAQAPAASSAPARAASPVAAAQRVNANTASQAEVEQALSADGVPNASRWAREVVEYRPYPTDDPSFAKLRQNLAKYNPAPEVVDGIVAALTL